MLPQSRRAENSTHPVGSKRQRGIGRAVSRVGNAQPVKHGRTLANRLRVGRRKREYRSRYTYGLFMLSESGMDDTDVEEDLGGVGDLVERGQRLVEFVVVIAGQGLDPGFYFLCTLPVKVSNAGSRFLDCGRLGGVEVLDRPSYSALAPLLSLHSTIQTPSNTRNDWAITAKRTCFNDMTCSIQYYCAPETQGLELLAPRCASCAGIQPRSGGDSTLFRGRELLGARQLSEWLHDRVPEGPSPGYYCVSWPCQSRLLAADVRCGQFSPLSNLTGREWLQVDDRSWQ